jgi:hypothetical protein
MVMVLPEPGRPPGWVRHNLAARRWERSTAFPLTFPLPQRQGFFVVSRAQSHALYIMKKEVFHAA